MSTWRAVLMGALAGGIALTSPAVALDRTFSGSWGIVGPANHEMLGARLLFSERGANSVHVHINQMSGPLRESDGTAGSNYAVHTEACSCYYDIMIMTGREEMTWRLVKSGGALCVNSFHARKDP